MSTKRELVDYTVEFNLCGTWIGAASIYAEYLHHEQAAKRYGDICGLTLVKSNALDAEYRTTTGRGTYLRAVHWKVAH